MVGIPKVSFTTLNEIKANGAVIWNKTFVSGVAGLTWVGEDADYVKFSVVPGTWNFVGLGVLPMTTPKPPATVAPVLVALEKKTWTASASVSDGSYIFSGEKLIVDVAAANALDGDHWTGWRDMTKVQYPGQWFQVDMQKEQTFSKIIIDTTWAQWDSPAGYSVLVSPDGKTWSDPVATGAGQLGITTITFPVQHARFIKLMQTGMSAKYHWSIFEFNVYADK